MRRMTSGVVASALVREARSNNVASATSSEPSSYVRRPVVKRQAGPSIEPTSIAAAGNARAARASVISLATGEKSGDRVTLTA